MKDFPSLFSKLGEIGFSISLEKLSEACVGVEKMTDNYIAKAETYF